MSPVWTRLIRFVGTDNKIYFGEHIISKAEDTVNQLLATGSLEAKVIVGDVLSDEAIITDQVIKVQSLLAPLTREQIPIMKCIGLNYKAHSKQEETVTLQISVNIHFSSYSCRGWSHTSSLSLHLYQAFNVPCRRVRRYSHPKNCSGHSGLRRWTRKFNFGRVISI